MVNMIYQHIYENVQDNYISKTQKEYNYGTYCKPKRTKTSRTTLLLLSQVV